MAIDHEIKTLPIAVRVFPDPPAADGSSRSEQFWRKPEGILVIHLHSGARQELIGSYEVIVGCESLEKGLFHGPKADVRALKDYVAHHVRDTARNIKQFQLLTLREFLQLFYELAYKVRSLVVGFNVPVLLSRLAFASVPARGFFAGGFSLVLWTYRDKEGRERPNGFRPRICVKYIDRKRSLIAFTARNSPESEDLIPEGSQSGEPKPGYRFPGHFLDLRTLAFALTDELYSLEAACEAFGVEHGKTQT
jgi:hypothetical protein